MWQMLQLQSSLPCCSSFFHQNHRGFASGHQLALKQVEKEFYTTKCLQTKLWSLSVLYVGRLRVLIMVAMTLCNQSISQSIYLHSFTEPQLSSAPLLSWKIAQKKLPWNIVLLLGGGFALAKGSEVRVLCTQWKSKVSALKQ